MNTQDSGLDNEAICGATTVDVPALIAENNRLRVQVEDIVEHQERTHEYWSDLVAALTGDESPQLWRLEWLSTLLSEMNEDDVISEWVARHDDPSAVYEMIGNVRDLVSLCRAALKRAGVTGEKSTEIERPTDNEELPL